MIVYFETESGFCGIREAKTSKHVYRDIRADLGNRAGWIAVRKATKKDIAHVRAFGGYVPSGVTE